MTRKVPFLLTLGVIAVAWLWLGRFRQNEFRVGADLSRCLGLLRQIVQAEERCFQSEHAYVNLQDLGSEGCGGLSTRVADGVDQGFRVDVTGSGATYAVRLRPTSSNAFHSLYTDQTGTIRFGTRDLPAGPNSPILMARRTE